jgi:hypothetical protein
MSGVASSSVAIGLSTTSLVVVSMDPWFRVLTDAACVVEYSNFLTQAHETLRETYSALSSSATSETDFLASPNNMVVPSA